MIWALFCGLSGVGASELDQARAELALLIAETEDPVLEGKLQSIHDQLVALEGDGEAEEGAGPAPEAEPEPEGEGAPEPEREAEVGPASAPALGQAEEACSLEEFGQLRASVEQQAFSRDKIALVEKASARLHFSVEQLVGLLDLLDFGADKVQAAAILHPKLVDPQDFDVGNDDRWKTASGDVAQPDGLGDRLHAVHGAQFRLGAEQMLF